MFLRPNNTPCAAAWFVDTRIAGPGCTAFGLVDVIIYIIILFFAS